MEFIKSIPSLLGKSLRQRPRPLPFESSALSKLPPELILYIAHFLPLESASSFSICCRPIYFTLGTQYLKALEKNYWHRHELLKLLERELPNHIICYYCEKLHVIDRAPRHLYSHRWYYRQFESLNPFRTDRQLPCWEEVDRVITAFMFHQNFSFGLFQRTMKCYIQDLDYSKLLNLLSYKTCTSRRFGLVKQCSWRARIVGGSLLTREQTIFMLPPAQPIKIPLHWNAHICHHTRILPLSYFLRGKGILDNGVLLEPKEPRDHHNLVGMVRCNYCLTEFRIDLKQFKERGTAIFVTTWQDLGEGLSHLDPTWRRDTIWDEGPVAFELGSICAAFEQKEHFRFEFDGSLSKQDWKELFRSTTF
jgi:hypothetical protein